MTPLIKAHMRQKHIAILPCVHKHLIFFIMAHVLQFAMQVQHYTRWATEQVYYNIKHLMYYSIICITTSNTSKCISLQSKHYAKSVLRS